MQHLAASIAPTALGFALLVPLLGMLLIWGSALVMLISQVINDGGAGSTPALMLVGAAIVQGYMAAGIPAAIAGVWVALLSPFAAENHRFYAGAAVIGAVSTGLFVIATSPVPAIFGGAIFLALVGAVSSFVCAWLLRDMPLGRSEARRNRLSRDRAERLAKARAA